MSYKPADLEVLWTTLGSGAPVSIKKETLKAWLISVMHPQSGLMEAWLPKQYSIQNPAFQVGWSGLVGNILTNDQKILVWLKAKLSFPQQKAPAPTPQFPAPQIQQLGIQQFMGQEPAQTPAQILTPQPQQFALAPQSQQQPQAQQPAPQQQFQMPTDIQGLYDLKHSLSPDNLQQKNLFYRVIEEIKKVEGKYLEQLHLQNFKSRKDLADMLNVIGIIMNQLTIALNDGTDKLGSIVGMNSFGKLQLRSESQTQIVSQPQYHEQGPQGGMAPLNTQEIQDRQTAQVPPNQQQKF